MTTEEYKKLTPEERKKVKFKDLPTFNKRAIYFVGIMLFLIIIAIIKPNETVNNKTKSDQTSISNNKQDELEKKRIDSIVYAAQLEKYNSLIKKFVGKKDEFDNITSYTHVFYGNYRPTNITIQCLVNSTGYLGLISYYHGSSWLFHNQITALVGTVKMSTSITESHDTKHGDQIVDGGVYEWNTYDNDGGILQNINMSIDKRVKIRFIGKQYVKDIELSKLEIQAIKDCVQLSEAIYYLNNHKKN